MPNRLLLQIAAGLLVVLSTISTAAPTLTAQSPTRGTLFIVGGGTQPSALVDEFVRLAGGSKAHIVVFGMASVSGDRSGEAKAVDLRERGAQARNIWITREHANLDSIVQLLDSATGVWFGGGDQNKLTAVLLGTKVERAIHARFAAGAVVGGTSAGAAVISTPMITGTELNRGRDTTQDWTRIQRGTVQVDSGFSFLTNAIIDQHFLRRKRQNRLLSLVLATAPHLGAGIDEGTAIVVEPSGLWRIMGASSVLIVDARSAELTGASAAVLGASGVRMHLLPDGATFDPKSGTATLRGKP